MSNTKNRVRQKKNTERFRLLFRHITWKKSLTFFFFLLLAIIFWIMQVYSQELEIKLSLPVKYTNIDEDILFEQKLPSHIDVKIKDFGSKAIKYFNSSSDSLVIDLGVLMKESSSTKILQGQAYEQLIRTKILPNSVLLSIQPTFISYAYSKVAIKKVPVIFDGIVTLSPGYLLDGELSIYPDSIKIYGTQLGIDTLINAYTSKDTIENIDKSQSISILLKEPFGVEFRSKDIKLNIPVDKIITREVKIPIECINLPKDLNIKFFPSEVNISFSVGIKRNNLIDSNNFRVIVDYNEIINIKGNSLAVRVIDAPDFVRMRLPQPSEVEFILEQE